jgi:hypothetical protein
MANYNAETKRKLAKAKEYFKKQGPLYFRNGEVNVIIKKDTPKQTFEEVLRLINHTTYITVDQNGTKVTSVARRRTLKELFRIMYVTHPQLRLTTLIELIIEKFRAGYGNTIICSNISKRVYYFSEEPWQGRPNINGVFSGEATDEYEIDWANILASHNLSEANSGGGFGHTRGAKDLEIEKV